MLEWEILFLLEKLEMLFRKNEKILKIYARAAKERRKIVKKQRWQKRKFFYSRICRQFSAG